MLTDAQLADYERDGVLVLPGFVSDEACDELRAHTVKQLPRWASDSASSFSTTDQSHAQDAFFLSSGGKVRAFYEDGALDRVLASDLPLDMAINKLGHAMHDLDPVFEAFSRTPELAKVAEQIGFRQPLLLQSMYIFKPPSIGGEVILHTDHPFLWTEPQSVTGFWFALEDATVDNGCLWAIPGGHHQPVKQRFRRHGDGTTTEVFDPDPYDAADLVPLEAEKGTMVIIHGLLPHWSAPNRSARSRHAYTLHVIDGVCDYLDDNWLQRPDDLPLRGF